MYRVQFVDGDGSLLRQEEMFLFHPFVDRRDEDDGRFEYAGTADGVVVYRRVW